MYGEKYHDVPKKNPKLHCLVVFRINLCEHSMHITIFPSKATLTWHIYN
jgi:hypothetical protein